MDGLLLPEVSSCPPSSTVPPSIFSFLPEPSCEHSLNTPESQAAIGVTLGQYDSDYLEIGYIPYGSRPKGLHISFDLLVLF